MSTVTNQINPDSTIINCPKCDGRGFLERGPSDHEIYNGSYMPSDVISYDCSICMGMGEVERCANCSTVFFAAEGESYLNDYGWCFHCEKEWAGRSAVVWETDIDGMTMHHFNEVKPDRWARYGYQHEGSHEIDLCGYIEEADWVHTDKLCWCAEGGVIVNHGGTFTGIER